MIWMFLFGFITGAMATVLGMVLLGERMPRE
jgi:hypothetical protein